MDLNENHKFYAKFCFYVLHKLMSLMNKLYNCFNAGKMIQIITNFRNGHTGQLSAVTSFLLALGAIARIFTSIQETGDNVIIMTYVCSSVVNSIIALQVILYWNTTSQQTIKKKTQ